MLGVVEVGLLKGERERGDVVERALHGRDVRPDHGAEMVVAEFDAAFFHALEIPAGMVLFLFESVENALSKGIGRVGEFKQGQSHELDGKEFVVGEKVEEDGSLLFVFNLVGAGKWRAALVAAGEEVGGAARGIWDGDGLF